MNNARHFLLSALASACLGLVHTAPTLAQPSSADAGVPTQVAQNPSAIAARGPVVYVYEFTASWCPSCRLLRPIVEKTASHYGNFVKYIPIDIDNPETKSLVNKLGIQAVPAIYVQDRYGRTLNVLVGLQQGTFLDRILDNYQKQSIASSSSSQVQ